MVLLLSRIGPQEAGAKADKESGQCGDRRPVKPFLGLNLDTEEVLPVQHRDEFCLIYKVGQGFRIGQKLKSFHPAFDKEVCYGFDLFGQARFPLGNEGCMPGNGLVVSQVQAKFPACFPNFPANPDFFGAAANLNQVRFPGQSCRQPIKKCVFVFQGNPSRQQVGAFLKQSVGLFKMGD